MSRRPNHCCPCTKNVSANVATCGPNATANLYFCPGYGVGPNLCDCSCPPDCIAPDSDRAGSCCRCPRESAAVNCCRCHCHRRPGEEEGAQDTDRRRRCRHHHCCRPCPSGFRPSDNYWGRCYEED